MGQPWVPSAGELLLPNPAMGQIQDGNVSSSAPKPWAGKTRELRKELKLTPSDNLTMPGSFAYISWWKCHHHSHLPFLVLCIAAETPQDKVMRGSKSWWAKSQSSFSDVPVPEKKSSKEEQPLRQCPWPGLWTARGASRAEQPLAPLGFPLGSLKVNLIYGSYLWCVPAARRGKEWQNSVGNEA